MPGYALQFDAPFPPPLPNITALCTGLCVVFALSDSSMYYVMFSNH